MDWALGGETREQLETAGLVAIIPAILEYLQVSGIVHPLFFLP